MAETPLATAWERIRDRVSTMATTYREDGVLPETDIHYVDVDRTRLYILDVYDETADLRTLVAGGIDHESLTQVPDVDGPARTIVRSATGTVALELRHSDIAPFLINLR